jgi:hypothetical protein
MPADEARLRSTCPDRPSLRREDAAAEGTIERPFSVALESGLGMTSRFGTCRGARLDDVRDEDDETDAACPTYWAFIAAAVWDGGSKRGGESEAVALLGGVLREPRLRPSESVGARVVASEGWPP